jgi:hypothetical protein
VSVAQWPKVTVATTQRSVTAYGGAVLLRDVMATLGLVDEVDATLGLKKRCRGLSEGHFVAAVAESVALGSSCLDDLAVARGDTAQEVLRGFAVPAPQTAGTWLRRFSLGHVRQLAKAMATVQRRAYEMSGADAVTLDFDSTYIFSRSKRRQGVDRTYKKGYAVHPLLCFDAGSGAAVAARLRRGKVHTAAGMKTFLGEALRAVPKGLAVRVRMDSGFYSGELLAQMEAVGVTYLCGVRMTERLTGAVVAIAEGCWTACPDKEEGEVAELGYRIAGTERFRRYVAKRIMIAPGEQASLETGGYRYWVLVTNDHGTGPLALEAEHRHKARVEAGMRELKSNFGLSVLRKHGFMANWAWLLLVCLGHNLCCWLQSLGRLAAGRDGTELKAKRLRYRYLAVPALVVRSARRTTVKLPDSYPYLSRFISTREHLGQLRRSA